MQEAITEYLEDLEDVYIAKKILKDLSDSKEPAITIEDVKKRYGL
jgi:RHH-type rel operon transcriptional repressor/antitoxin RelB